MAFNAKLTRGDWVRHEDGTVGAVQSYGHDNNDSPKSYGIKKSSRVEAMRWAVPYVQVTVRGIPQWWRYSEIECCVAAPMFSA